MIFYHISVWGWVLGLAAQCIPFVLPLVWFLFFVGKGNSLGGGEGGSDEEEGSDSESKCGNKANADTMNLLKKVVGVAFMLSVGVLMPGFLFMGWSRDARAVDDMFSSSAALANLHFNGSSYMYRNLSRGVPNLEDVIIFGETERGVDFESQDGRWEEVKSKRDFIKKVGSYTSTFIQSVQFLQRRPYLKWRKIKWVWGHRLLKSVAV